MSLAHRYDWCIRDKQRCVDLSPDASVYPSRCQDVSLMCPTHLTGIYYEPGKEPPAEGPPKLHLLIESNEEWRVSSPMNTLNAERGLTACDRSSKPCGRSSGCWWRRRLLRCKQRCETPRLPRGGTALCKVRLRFRCNGFVLQSFVTMSSFVSSFGPEARRAVPLSAPTICGGYQGRLSEKQTRTISFSCGGVCACDESHLRGKIWDCWRQAIEAGLD